MLSKELYKSEPINSWSWEQLAQAMENTDVSGMELCIRDNALMVYQS